MPTTRRRLAALAAVLALTPSTALAQNAGDEQYTDPLAGGGGGSGTSTTQPSPSPSPAPSQQPAAPAPPRAQAQSPAPGAPAAAAPAATASAPGQAELPRTGLDLRVVAGAGLVLLLAGL